MRKLIASLFAALLYVQYGPWRCMFASANDRCVNVHDTGERIAAIIRLIQ